MKNTLADVKMNTQDQQNLVGLLGFAKGILNARSKVQMEMDSRMGLFPEMDIMGLPGIQLNCENGVWLSVERQYETKPPICDDPHVQLFMEPLPSEPMQKPKLKPITSLKISIEEASDLEEAGLLKHENISPILEDGIEQRFNVKILLELQKFPEINRKFEQYVSGPWQKWAQSELPVRQAVKLYNALFKINLAIHTSEGSPPELVWGVGIGRWVIGDQRIDMPLIEQLLDIEVTDKGGAINIRPRDLEPTLSLKPYFELEIGGSSELQSALQENLKRLLSGDIEASPFTTIFDPILATAASRLSSTGRYIARDQINNKKIPAPSETLHIIETWAIFARPRTNEARSNDLEALIKKIDGNKENYIPDSIRGYVENPPDQNENDDIPDLEVILQGNTPVPWNQSTKPVNSKSVEQNTKRINFFPLPFNDEQGKIAEMIDSPELSVVCVSGPPGTGKSHSIANIISHQMAIGKRVLVTARTPEAISAVREKLPASLQPLVIASVGTDRQSAQQLQMAITELSNEVVSLDVDGALAEKSRLEQKIVNCDKTALSADQSLAEIARSNLSSLQWGGNEHTPMDFVAILEANAATYGWFTDRPQKTPPAQLHENLARLKTILPTLAADIIYADSKLPSPEELPLARELIVAHDAELNWSNTREAMDYSTAPIMARDGTESETRARTILQTLEACKELIQDASDSTRKFAIHMLGENTEISLAKLDAIKEFISGFNQLENITKVRFNLGQCAADDFLNALLRGTAGQKMLSLAWFKSALKEAIASTRIGEHAPSSPEQWGIVLAAFKLEKDREHIDSYFETCSKSGLVEPTPSKSYEIANFLLERQHELQIAIEIASRLKPTSRELYELFPYGLDIEPISTELDCEYAIFALKGNLPEEKQSVNALVQLQNIVQDSELPVFIAINQLKQVIGDKDTRHEDIIRHRNEITDELNRLNGIKSKLDAIVSDLSELKRCGATYWADNLQRKPERAVELIPENWVEAWSWGQMSLQVEQIIRLGNGDEQRKGKAEALHQRRKALEELIRIRTLLGLKKRMTPAIAQSMEAFTQAVSKIGTGKGKKAPRFIREAQKAAKKASSAAPVWIMPEYKIPEQLSPDFGDFDLVILDEASQSDITSLAALARGKKILVVGDEAQVSPSVVGIPIQKVDALRAEFLNGVPSGGLMDENSSIFEVTKQMHPQSHMMLREHFRCVAPIIQFSTRFYNNALIPLRVPKASERFDPPLCDVYIPNAKRQGKTNVAEAQWIVDEIARLIIQPEHVQRDIGIISLLGGEQADLIGRMLVEDERIGPEKIKERRIIFGDARTMQGQERSVVFLSMVATSSDVRSQAAKSDHQRVNVAMSRARDRLYLVRSVQGKDLKDADIKSKILHHFRDPMPDGRPYSPDDAGDLADKCDSGFEREVLNRLLASNYRVQPQVSAGAFSIDLVVDGEEDRRLAIELDGDQFHGADVWERDMSRQAALERAGWVFWRVFGSQWNANKDFWWNDLIEKLNRLKIKPIGAKAVDERFTETITVDVAMKMPAEVEAPEPSNLSLVL